MKKHRVLFTPCPPLKKQVPLENEQFLEVDTVVMLRTNLFSTMVIYH